MQRIRRKELTKRFPKFINNAYKRATEILKKHRKVLDVLVERLLKVETLEREEFEKLIREQGVLIQKM